MLQPWRQASTAPPLSFSLNWEFIAADTGKGAGCVDEGRSGEEEAKGAGRLALLDW